MGHLRDAGNFKIFLEMIIFYIWTFKPEKFRLGHGVDGSQTLNSMTDKPVNL